MILKWIPVYIHDLVQVYISSSAPAVLCIKIYFHWNMEGAQSLPGSTYQKIFNCLTSRIVHFFNIEGNFAQIHLPDW